MRTFNLAALPVLFLVGTGCSGSSGGSPDTGTGNDAGMVLTMDGGTNDGGASSDAGSMCPTSVTPGAGLVLTDRGPVQGAKENGTWSYLGIPYAAPPIGALRWSATQAHDCWHSPLMATSYGPACPQPDPNDPAKVVGQEDCLTANVWSPESANAKSNLPVLVFIHGGGNVQGSAGEADPSGGHAYDGAALAAKENAVVVTFNYRLGALGFLAHPSFGDHPGNYGMLDQIFALAWVQRNAAALGGDTSKVLVFGQSAGAEDVCNLVASPLAKHLFSAALMESGACTAHPLATAVTFAHTWAQKAGCDSASDPAACMRALDATALTALMPEPANISGKQSGDYEPDVDGVVLPDLPAKILASGAQNHVPFVIGSNSDETSKELAKAYPQGMTAQQFQAAVLAYASGNQSVADSITTQYPPSSFGNDLLETYVQITTDAKFTCSARYAARQAVMGQTDQPVFRYFYTHHLDDAAAATKALGAWHAQELAFVFRELAESGYTPSSGEQSLSDAIDAIWTSMASAGTPGSGGGVTFPRYDATSDPYVQIDDTFTTGTGIRTANCDFWDKLVGR